ncbi:VTT domain-containing protein [Pseudonocardia nigra]|uniref:VTT domain-containing protein n=1 Tax=Pseudonocardia nigra TaxID=1921578 RepID=UPI001C5DC139|nr:VTT domain-containing protein [Pseudonocardia nigra]
MAVEAAGVPLLTDPSAQLSRADLAAAVVGVGLLVTDVVLPVPSSVVMVAHGALFGAVAGTLLSLAGSVGAGLTGFALGRRGGPLLDRLVPASERRRADALLGRWGALAVVVTRPVPVLAETTAILAGATRSLSWLRMGLAAAVGSLPATALYALAGAAAAGFVSVSLIFAVVLVLAAVTWLVERRRARGGREGVADSDETGPRAQGAEG